MRESLHRFLTLLGAILAAWSLLTWFQAPAKPFFYLALAATELGQYIALASFLIFLFTRQWFCLLTALLFLSPSFRAARISPLDWNALFTGITIPEVAPKTVEYATHDGEALKMDIYPQAMASTRPCILVIHGGSWSSGSRKDFDSLTRFLWSKGYVVASLDYRLSPRNHFPAARDDVFDALRYLKSNANTWGLDASRFVLLGRSAGGQLALSAAYNSGEHGIRAVIALYAPNDLKLAYTKPGNPLIINSKKVISDYLGGTLTEVPTQYEAASPLVYAGEYSPPTLLIHGGRDEFVWPLHSERLSAKLTSIGRPCEYLRLPWATHGADYFLHGPSGQLITKTLIRFLDTTTGGYRL